MMALFAVFACERVEELSQLDKEQETVVEKVEMNFSAVIESDDTKTVLVDSDVENVKKVFWQPEDAIGVSVWTPVHGCVQVDKFTSTLESPEKRSNFKGDAPMASSYKAFYPYTETLKDSSNFFYFDVPSMQKYVEGSFDPKAALMVASADYGEEFNFKNLFSILGFRITGVETVKSITFSAYNEYGEVAPLSGRFSVNPADEALQMNPYDKLGYTLTLNCDEPVQLDQTTPSVFYMMIPPGTYSSFAIAISTVDSGVMIKETTNQLNLERSHIKHAGTLNFVEIDCDDLSKYGTANSYIVTESGNYSFDASIIGNGGYGLIEGAGFHTESPFITPVSAELLWQDRPGVVSIVSLSKGKVCFRTTGVEGNAVIAAKDESGTILWSWHIWRTDSPEEHTYNTNDGNTYVMMDRALGSISAIEGDEGGALYYQWGRKDPFSLNETNSLHSRHNLVGQFSSMSKAIASPTDFPTGYNWVVNLIDTYWSKSAKTIYDPCPSGWKVPGREVWNGIKVKHDRDGGPYGVVLYFNEEDYFWYPDTPRISSGGGMDGSYTGDKTHFWTAECGVTKYLDHSNSYEIQHDRCDGQPIRCMKDENYETSLRPMVTVLSFQDIHSEGATIKAAVTAEGISSVTERGLIWGTTQELDYDSPNRQVVEGSLGEFTYTLTGLEKATKYYVRAYAINDYDISYSDVKSFNTTHDGNVFDLSLDGKANCYIVPPTYGEYAFDATVKGNSTEPVGDIASVEVLWETKLTSRRADASYIEEVQTREIIDTVTFDGKLVHITLPFNPVPGNALVAVKDAYGTILWSWHIWVVDYDPEDTKVKLSTGIHVMDRNIGALSVTESPKSFGCYYQWGRKDPLIPYDFHVAPSEIKYELYNAMVDIESITQYPDVILDDIMWTEDNLWASDKTKYDPCPAGWRVSEYAAWEYLSTNGDNGMYGYVQVGSEYTSSSLYLPKSGYTCGDSWIADWNNDVHFWMLGKKQLYFYYYYNYSNTLIIRTDYIVSDLAPVRCMKDVKGTVSGDGNDLVVDDKYEW